MTTGILHPSAPAEGDDDNMATLLLIHGGLWEDMDAGRFWHGPGISARLKRHGFEVIAPDRLR